MFGVTKKHTHRERAHVECAVQGKGRGKGRGKGNARRAKQGGCGDRKGRGMGAGGDFRGGGSPRQAKPLVRPEQPVQPVQAVQPGQPGQPVQAVQPEQPAQMLKNEASAMETRAAQPLFCPICENHCSLDDPACPKGKAYANSLQSKA